MKQEELDEMLKEAPGPINFTVFLTMFGEKLKGETRLDASYREWRDRCTYLTLD